ncbi:2OG-Fe(II) oxygenase family protein [Idiomarina sp. M1R2S28]|uniref:2OG-Fe(II) oxygenase family protein n=1 Tax=Idiomarina rhizosphaerae TaxID=2961572 RepID=A0A9X2JT56_9GAMM|nr:putative 2OG-Fe(II) oxygenase [Idiomarina rhizosphaerae]MCP1339974.1 2OG-Fe(II) oxygenase family protein [Idiomarina rhizosphaerae]
MIKPLNKFMPPIAVLQVPSSENLNETLKRSLNELKSEGYSRDKFPTDDGDVFVSQFDLFKQSRKDGISELSAIFKQVAQEVTAYFCGLSKSESLSLNYSFESWFHFSYYGSSKSVHSHGEYSWAMVYYVDTGDIIDNKKNSGKIRLYNPNKPASVIPDFVNEHLQGAYSSSNITLSPRNGTLIVFPGYLEHEVLTYWGESPRVMVAANCKVT